MTFNELESLASQLYVNGADIPVSALTLTEEGARLVHIEASPKSISFFETKKIPESKELLVSKILNDPDWIPEYSNTHKLTEGDWELCNLPGFNKELLATIHGYTGKVNELWNILQKVNYDKLL